MNRTPQMTGDDRPLDADRILVPILVIALLTIILAGCTQTGVDPRGSPSAHRVHVVTRYDPNATAQEDRPYGFEPGAPGPSSSVLLTLIHRDRSDGAGDGDEPGCIAADGVLEVPGDDRQQSYCLVTGSDGTAVVQVTQAQNLRLEAFVRPRDAPGVDGCPDRRYRSDDLGRAVVREGATLTVPFGISCP